MPYYWTDALTGWEYRGAGIYADVVLEVDGAKISVSINGRPSDEGGYAADPNDYEGQIVYTDGLFCRDGWISDLRFEQIPGYDQRLSGTLIRQDGSQTEVIFHTGSEDTLY